MINAQLSEKAGTSLRLKRGKYISLEVIEKICFTLQCRVDDILDCCLQNNGHNKRYDMIVSKDTKHNRMR